MLDNKDYIVLLQNKLSFFKYFLISGNNLLNLLNRQRQKCQCIYSLAQFDQNSSVSCNDQHSFFFAQYPFRRQAIMALHNSYVALNNF